MVAEVKHKDQWLAAVPKMPASFDGHALRAIEADSEGGLRQVGDRTAGDWNPMPDRLEDCGMKRLFFGLIAATALSASIESAETDALTIKQGELDGAKYVIVIPKRHINRLVLNAHGLRSTDQPLSAGFDPKQPFFQGLTKEGWIIAFTSYRRNGWIIDDAVADLRALRAEVERELGHSLTQTILIGESMGGMVAARAVEMEPKLCDGALAVDAAHRDDDSSLLLYTPKVPILFLSNVSEAAGPRAYVARVKANPVISALWTVNRAGHMQVTHIEAEHAFHALLDFIRTGQIAEGMDATADIRRTTSQLTFAGGTATCDVVGLNSAGAVTTNVIAEDMARLQIMSGSKFLLFAGSRKFDVRFDPDVSHHYIKEADSGEWISYILEVDGLLRIACVGQNAGELLNVSEGAQLRIAR